MAEIYKGVFEDVKGNRYYAASDTEITYDTAGIPLNNGGDLSEASVNFTVSSSRKALTAKARFKALMGDIAKWLTDLGPAAFYKVADDFTTTAENYLFTARKGKQLKDEVDNLNQNLTALNDSGAIKGMDAREDGVYITYSTGADTVTKKLGSPEYTLGHAADSNKSPIDITIPACENALLVVAANSGATVDINGNVSAGSGEIKSLGLHNFKGNTTINMGLFQVTSKAGCTVTFSIPAYTNTMTVMFLSA